MIINMRHLGRLTSTPYLVLFIILGAVGVSTATAMVMVTVAGNFTVEGDSDFWGNLLVIGLTTGPTTDDIYNHLTILYDNVLVPDTNPVVSIPSGTSIPGCEDFNECYIPSVVIVTQGDSVTWLNEDFAAHTVTSGTPGGGPTGEFDSSLFIPGSGFIHQFLETGPFPYFCLVHPWMTGSVFVVP